VHEASREEGLVGVQARYSTVGRRRGETIGRAAPPAVLFSTRHGVRGEGVGCSRRRAIVANLPARAIWVSSVTRVMPHRRDSPGVTYANGKCEGAEEPEVAAHRGACQSACRMSDPRVLQEAANREPYVARAMKSGTGTRPRVRAARGAWRSALLEIVIRHVPETQNR